TVSVFGTISTFRKCSDRFGFSSRFFNDVFRVIIPFLKNDHSHIRNAWIVDLRRNERTCTCIFGLTTFEELSITSADSVRFRDRKEIPQDDNGQRLLLYAGADHVLHKVLRWGKAQNDLDRLKLRLSQLYYHNLVQLSEPVEGLKEWLDALASSNIPCAVVSSVDRRNMVEALERMGLKKYFQAIVSEEDGMESIAHRFLSAAIKLDRKPSKCVVFEDDPRGVTAAHNCTMMAVALIGAHPAYDLGQADLAVASFNELSVINLRRLFAHKGSSFMELEKQIIETTPSRRKLTIDTIF
ncbi:haloacid dehalogenase-like hydrolase superfamily, partial, partial [Olea europaea subsp. europaea]